MAIPISITIDNLGLASAVGQGLASAPDPDEPGLSIGLPRILDVLARHGVRGTFFVEGWNGIHHPDHVRRIVDAGHEVGCHGWVHEAWRDLDEATERELLSRSIDALASCGAEVTGFRAPGGQRSPTTLAVLAQLGLVYDASLDSGGAHTDAGGIAVLPFEWAHVDWHWFGARNPPATPGEFAEALDEGLEHATTRGVPLVAVFHPRTSGLDDDRLAILDRFAAGVTSDDRFELVTMATMADRVRAQ